MSLWPNKTDPDTRPPLGSGYQRITPVRPRRTAVPAGAPGELRLDATPSDVIPDPLLSASKGPGDHHDRQTHTPPPALRKLGFDNVPAVPGGPAGMADTLVRLGIKVKQYEQALQGLSRTYTIRGTTARAYTFLYGNQGPDAQRPRRVSACTAAPVRDRLHRDR